MLEVRVVIDVGSGEEDMRQLATHPPYQLPNQKAPIAICRHGRLTKWQESGHGAIRLASTKIQVGCIEDP